MNTRYHRSIRPGECACQENMLVPWYGCQNMETDAPPVTGSNGGPLVFTKPVNADQEKLWAAKCYAELTVRPEGNKLVECLVVHRRRASDGIIAQRILGRTIKVKVVG